MHKGYMTTREVCEYFKFSRVTLYRRVKDGEFPKPVIQGGGRTCKWKIDDLEEYEKTFSSIKEA